VKWKGEINSAGLNDLTGSEPDLVFDMSIHWTGYNASSIVFWWN